MAEKFASGWKRWALRIGGGAAAILLALVAAWQIGLLNGAALWLVGQASGYRISCARLDGGLLSKFTCEGLTLSDEKGRFLTAKKLSLHWKPWALISNEADIRDLSLIDAKLTRIPGSSSPSPGGGFLPGTRIAIGDLKAEHLVLAMPSAPQACLNLAVKGHIGPDGFAAGLGLVRCAPKNGRMVFQGSYVKATGAVHLAGEGRDNGALAAAFTGVTAAGPTQVTLKANGTISALDGAFALKSENLASIDASFTARDLTATSIKARFNIVPALLPRWAPRGAGTISTDVTGGPQGSFDVSSLLLDWGGVKGVGHLALGVDGALGGALKLDTMQAFTISDARIGGLTAVAKIGGTRNAPSLRGTATFRDVASGAASLTNLRADFSATRARDGGIKAELAGNGEGASFPAPLSGLAGAAFDFHAAGNRMADGALSFNGAFKGSAATLVATARIGARAGQGDVTLTVPDLAKAQAGFGGSAKAALHFTRMTLGGDLRGALSVQGMSVTPDGPGKVLGPSPMLRAELSAEGGNYAFTNLVLDTKAVAAEGAARLASTGQLAADLKTVRGELAPFSDWLGRKLQGAFSLVAHVSGTRAAPEVTLNASAPRLAVDRNIAKGTAIALIARKQKAWTGKISVISKTPSGPVNLGGDVTALDAGWRAVVTKGALGPAHLSGQLAKRGETYAGALTLKGELLGPVGFVLGQPMHGQGAVSLRGEKSGLHLVVDLQHIAARGLQDATLKADAALGGTGRVFRAKLDLSDGQNKLAATASASFKPLAVTLNSLSGAWSGADFALEKPAIFTRAEGRFTLAPARIGISGGVLTLAGSGDGKALDASAHLAGMPVAPLATMLRLGKASGTLAFDLTAKLSPGSSDAKFDLSAQKLLFSGAGKKDKPADIHVTAQWNGRAVALDGRISGLDARDATLTANVPMVRAAGGYLPKLAQSGPVSAQLRAQLRAERLIALLPLAEQNVTGQLTASADVTGDIADPQLSGTVSLADGSFTDFETGTRLTKLDAALAAAGGDRFSLKATGRDGNSGTLKANGEFTMAALEAGGAGHMAGHLDVDLNNAQVLRQDLAHAALTGHIGVDLPGDQPGTITGKLRSNTVRIDLGAAIPPDIPQIEVIEINAGSLPPSTPRRAPSLFGKTHIDVAIAMPNRVYVTGHGADTEWNGNLKIAGTVADPDVSGKLSLLRGQAELIGKTFTLQQGTVQISNSIPGNASVHIVGQNDSSDISVTVTIDGPVTKPELSWSSSPALPRSEILSRLFFGTSSPHLSVGQAFQLAQLSGQLDRFGLGDSSGGGILGFARKLTGLDVLRVSAPSDLDGNGTGVSAGKYLSDRVYVGVKQGAKLSAGAAEVQVKITPHITLDAEAGANSQGAAGLSWKWDY